MSHEVEKAMELCAEAQQSGLTSEASTYGALISACEKGDKVKKAMEPKQMASPLKYVAAIVTQVSI